MPIRIAAASSAPGLAARLAITGAALASLLLLAVSASAAPERESALPLEDSFLQRMGDWFEAHPELKTTRSSGWKPYNRVKWGTERNLANGSLPTARDRWDVWEVKQEIESRRRAPAASWFEIGPTNLTVRITSIAFDPTIVNIVYVGAASGGLWKSTNGGDTWVPLTDELPSLGVGGVAVDPFDPQIVILATGEGTPNADRVGGVGILKSTDGGATWNATSVSFSATSGHGFHFVEVEPGTGVYLAGSVDGLWRSTDAGDNWTKVDGTTEDYFDAKWKPGDAQRVYTARGSTWGGTVIRMSTDAGVTWSTLGGGLPSSSGNSKTKIAVTDAQPSWVYVNIVSSSTYGSRGIWRSTNDGVSWSARNTSLNMTGGQGWYNLTLAVDPNDANRVIAGGVELYRSTDGGLNFAEVGDGYGLGTDTAVHWDHHAIAWEPGSTSNLWVGTDGGVWRSTDDGENWLSRREGISTYQFYDICVAQSDPSVTLGGTQDNGVPGRVGVDDWFTSNLFADGFVCNINFDNADIVYAEAQFGYHVRSSDGGATWDDWNLGLTGSGDWMTPVAQDRHVTAHLYTESGDGIWRRMPGGGGVWSKVGTHSAKWIDISPVDGNIVWTIDGGSTAPRFTMNDGGSWGTAAPYGFSIGSSSKILAHPTDASTALVTFSGFTSGISNVAMTTDMGATWTDVTGDLPNQTVNAIVVDPQYPDEWFIGTDVGVWQSVNGGVNWTPFETGLPNAVVSDLEIREDARKLVAGTYGRGAWEVQITSTGLDATVTRGPAPWNLMLDPPSPNPVTEQTVLRFAARTDAAVELSVYDVRGRLVSNLAELSSGDGVIRRAVWLPEDVPAGVYFAVLKAGADRISRKVVVTK